MREREKGRKRERERKEERERERKRGRERRVFIRKSYSVVEQFFLRKKVLLFSSSFLQFSK